MGPIGGFNFKLPADFQLPPNFQVPGGMVNPAPVPLPPMPAPVAPMPMPMPGIGGEGGIGGFLPKNFDPASLYSDPNMGGGPVPMPMPQNPQVPMPQPMPMPAPQPMPPAQAPQILPGIGGEGGGFKPTPAPMPAPYDDSGNGVPVPPRVAPMPQPMPAPEPTPPQTFGQGPEVISDPAGSIGGTNPVFDMNNLDFSNLDLSNIPGYTPEPGGIESLAPTTPMTAEFVAPTGGIPMPGGGTFDPGIGGEGGTPQMGTLGGPVYDDAGNLIGNLGSAGPLFGEGGAGSGPGFTFTDPNPAESGGTTPDTSNGLTPAQQASIDAFNEQYPNGFDPFSGGGFDPGIGGEGGAGSGPGMGNGPGFTMGGTDASGNGNGPGGPGNNTNPATGSGNADEEGSGNPYPFIPPGTDTTGMTPEILAGLNSFYEQYPNGVGFDPFSSGFDFNFTPGGTTGTTTPVVPVDPVDNLGGNDPDPDTGTYAPRVAQDVNVSAASNYALTGAVPTQPVDSGNPFARPESQQGIGSLGGG